MINEKPQDDKIEQKPIKEKEEKKSSIEMPKQSGMSAKSLSKIIYGLIVSITIFVILIGMSFVYAIDIMSKEMNDNKYITLKNHEKMTALLNLKSNFEDISSDKERVGRYLPDEKDVSDILRDIEDIAAKHSPTFESFVIESAVKKKDDEDLGDIQLKKVDNYLILPFTINLKGSYSKINSILAELERHDRLLEVESIQYKRINDDTNIDSDTIDAEIKINSYLK